MMSEQQQLSSEWDNPMDFPGNNTEEYKEPVRLAKGMAAHNMKLLPEDFVLGEKDVICGRGRTCFNHIGNQRFRELVAGCLDRYSGQTKLEKTFTICDIVHRVRLNSPSGGFVKKDPVSGRFYEVGDYLAREKTSQAFRDALADQYKSSNAAKKKRRLHEQASKLRKRNSEPSLLTMGLAADTGNDIVTERMTENALEQLDQELNASFNRGTPDSSAENLFCLLQPEPQQHGQRSGWHSCPDLGSANLDNLSLGVTELAAMEPQPIQWGAPNISNFQDPSKSHNMACGKPNEVLQRMLQKQNDQQQADAQALVNQSQQMFQQPVEAQPASQALHQSLQQLQQLLPQQPQYQQQLQQQHFQQLQQPTQQQQLNMQVSMGQSLTAQQQNTSAPQGMDSNLMFEKLFQFTEENADMVGGDPFEPVPLPEAV